MNKTFLMTVMVLVMIVLIGWIVYLVMGRTDTGVPVQATYADKIVYTLDLSTDKEPFIEHCRARGGTFNECGSPCPSNAEACISVCAFTCDLVESPGPALNEGTFAVGETKELQGLSITLLDIVSDSRCPIDAVCIQQGSVTLKIRTTSATTTEEATFSSTESHAFAGYDIMVGQIMPSPIAGKTIADSEYRVALLVQKQ